MRYGFRDTPTSDNRAVIYYHLDNFQEAFRFWYTETDYLSLVLLSLHYYNQAAVTESHYQGFYFPAFVISTHSDQISALTKLLHSLYHIPTDEEIRNLITLTELLK